MVTINLLARCWKETPLSLSLSLSLSRCFVLAFVGVRVRVRVRVHIRVGFDSFMFINTRRDVPHSMPVSAGVCR